MKAKPLDEMVQSAYLFVILHVKHKKITIYREFNWFLILGKSKIPTIASDVTAGLQQRHHPQNVPPLVEKIKGFPLKAKSFRNTAADQNLSGRVPSTPPPHHPLVPR